MGETQSNTRKGLFPIFAFEDLTGKEGFLAVIVDDAGTPKAALPSNNTDETLYLIESGGLAGAVVQLIPLSGESNQRVFANGVGTAGNRIVLADVGTAADKGKVRAVPGVAGTYFSPGILEEGMEPDAAVLFRPAPRLVVVP